MNDQETKVVAAFQKAARKVIRRMAEDRNFCDVMGGTETYSLILDAYALSLGKELPELACIEPVKKIWELLHAEPEAGK